MKRILLLLIFGCTSFALLAEEERIVVGAESTDEYFPLLEGKRIGVFSNHTGMVGDEHLVDLLCRSKMNIVTVFAPEHGFRGDADAGERIDDSVDIKTGIPIYSLYKTKTGKPSPEIMSKLDVVVFDIQDVGLRFYTYYISMYKMMDACADNNQLMIILDRPNPNGFYVDGPILDMKYKSGVGYLPIPVVHGMTLGELAKMINGEGWLPQKKKCRLIVIPCKHYTHQMKYQLPIAPSPNLPNMKSIYLYPSVCLFEGTPVSLGRGTAFPFQVYGHPKMKNRSFSFTPKSIPGAKKPPCLNQVCHGVDLRNIPDESIWEEGINLNYLIDAYTNLKIGEKFFTSFFRNLIGVDYVEKMIMEGKSAREIKAVWKKDVEHFIQQRRPYLLYECSNGKED
ncbi:MAG: DUF1343 domain-containing protein [Dysgonamonadaceae bacterium]|jgi:uncharacterized protein YbbC (DUF1343 family)|nr:DUF1343 domain-containing protein [Dysgonamonadaceae bacterium]